MLKMSIKITGDKAVMRKLGNLRTMNLTTAFKEIGEEAIDYYSNDSFATSGTNLGRKWPALNPAYKKWKEKKYGTASRMLVATGTMQKSFFAKTTKNSVAISNKADYYKYHQSTAPRSKIPRRPMAGINKHIKDIVRTAINKDIDKILRAN
jgi:phage gpG-like protein